MIIAAVFDKEGRFRSDRGRLLNLGFNIDWGRVSSEVFGGRFDRLQLYHRYVNVLHPTFRNTEWAPEEDAVLMRLYEEGCRDKWRRIVEQLDYTRSCDDCKNRYRSIVSARAADAQLVSASGGAGGLQGPARATSAAQPYQQAAAGRKRAREPDALADATLQQLCHGTVVAVPVLMRLQSGAAVTIYVARGAPAAASQSAPIVMVRNARGQLVVLNRPGRSDCRGSEQGQQRDDDGDAPCDPACKKARLATSP